MNILNWNEKKCTDKIYFMYKINRNTVYAKKFNDPFLYGNEKTVYEYIKKQRDGELNKIVKIFLNLQ